MTDEILWNDAVQTLFGYRPEDVLRRWHMVGGAHPSR